jgi:hypothetical protein
MQVSIVMEKTLQPHTMAPLKGIHGRGEKARGENGKHLFKGGDAWK